MSKGPGKWQRLILDELGRRSWVKLADLLPADHTRSDYVALMRAAHGLKQVELWRVRGETQNKSAWCGRSETWFLVAAFGNPLKLPETLNARFSVSVDGVANCSHGQHLEPRRLDGAKTEVHYERE